MEKAGVRGNWVHAAYGFFIALEPKRSCTGESYEPETNRGQSSSFDRK